MQDIKVGPTIGDIKPGDLEILDLNPPTDENAWYWIRLARLPKK